MRKHLLLVLLSIFSVCALSACTTTMANNGAQPQSTDIESQQIEQTLIIQEVTNGGWLAAVVKDENAEPSGCIFIPEQTGDEHYEVGDYIIVCSNGIVEEIYPGRYHTIWWTKLKPNEG